MREFYLLKIHKYPFFCGLFPLGAGLFSHDRVLGVGRGLGERTEEADDERGEETGGEKGKDSGAHRKLYPLITSIIFLITCTLYPILSSSRHTCAFPCL